MPKMVNCIIARPTFLYNGNMMTTIDISQTEPNWLELLRKVKEDGISVLFMDGEQQLAELRVPKRVIESPKATYQIIETADSVQTPESTSRVQLASVHECRDLSPQTRQRAH